MIVSSFLLYLSPCDGFVMLFHLLLELILICTRYILYNRFYLWQLRVLNGDISVATRGDAAEPWEL